MKMQDRIISLDDRVAIVILNYNDYSTTINLCRMVEEYPSLYKVIIVDNHSTDGSYDIIRKECKSEKVVILNSKINGGYGYGNNLGVKYSNEVLNCKYVLIANPDIEITNECIDHMHSFMNENEDCVIVAPLQRLHTETGSIIQAWKLPSLKEEVLSSNVLLSRLSNIKKYYDFKYSENGKMEEVDVVQGALLMINTEKFLRFGGYDEEIFLYNEEQCIAQKAKKLNFKSYIATSEIYIHHHSVSINKSIKSLQQRKKQMLNSKMIYIKKYFRLNKAREIAINAFFKLCIIESGIIGIIKGGR